MQGCRSARCTESLLPWLNESRYFRTGICSLCQNSQNFEQMAARSLVPWDANLTAKADERLQGSLVTANFFETLGRRRFWAGFMADEGQPGNNQVVVLSHQLWQRRLVAKTC